MKSIQLCNLKTNLKNDVTCRLQHRTAVLLRAQAPADGCLCRRPRRHTSAQSSPRWRLRHNLHIAPQNTQYLSHNSDHKVSRIDSSLSQRGLLARSVSQKHHRLFKYMPCY